MVESDKKQSKDKKSSKRENKTKSKYDKLNKQRKKVKEQKGGNTDICKKDINDLLTTNKKIFTYNNPKMADGKSFTNQASQLGNNAVSGWGSNPGPPPDPSNCTIL